MVTGIKGKIGGTTFSGGYGAAVAKNKSSAVPKGKLTKADAGRIVEPTKTVFDISKAWRTMDDTERLAWNSAGADFPALNRFGDVYTPSGYQLFVQFNSRLKNINQSIITTPPSPSTVDTVDINPFTVGAGPELQYSLASNVPNTTILQIFATRSISLGAKPKASDYKMIAMFSNSDPTNGVITDNYEDQLGTFGVYGRIWIKCRFVDIASGQFSPEQIFNVVIEP